MDTQPKVERIERIITPMPKTLIEEIDDFRWGNRMPSRSQAIRELIRRGLGKTSGR
jgi:metal-responsive CopG/Arc/MetJ family transcriptional regulator